MDDIFVPRDARNEKPAAQIPMNDKTNIGRDRRMSSWVLNTDAAKTNIVGTTDGKIFRQLAVKPFADEKYRPLGRTSIIVLQYKEFDTA